MKLIRIISALFLIGFFFVGFILGQGNSKDKKSVEVKANLLIVGANNRKVDDVKIEDLKIFEDGIEQKIISFTKKAPILNLGIASDNSGSLRPQLKDIIGINQFLTANITDKDEAFLTRFVGMDNVSLIQDWTSDKALLNEAIDQMFIEAGPSVVVDGIYLSVDKILERAIEKDSKRFAIVLISDCEERDSYYSKKKLFEKLQGSGIQIFVIALTKDLKKSIKNKSESFAHELALLTGGTVYFPTTEENRKKPIDENLKMLVYELRAQYEIDYISTNQKRDGLARKLTVQVSDSEKGEKRQAFIRESFVVPKD